MRDPGLPTFTTLSQEIQHAIFMRLRVMQPAKVLAYDDATSTAKLELAFQDVVGNRDGDERVNDAIVVDNVPVVQLGGPVSYFRIPITPGTTGVAMVMDRSLGTWRALGNAAAPPLPVAHQIADLVFIPGLRPDSAPLLPAAMGGLVMDSTTMQLGAAAILGAARVTDPTAATVDLIAWMSAVTALSVAIAATADGAPVIMTPALRAAVAALNPALQATAVANTTMILSGSTKTFIE